LYNVDPFANSTPVAHEDIAKLDDFHNPPKLLLEFSEEIEDSIDELPSEDL
jgi:hypothetical protein